jgi:hypothetical protein
VLSTPHVDCPQAMVIEAPPGAAPVHSHAGVGAHDWLVNVKPEALHE